MIKLDREGDVFVLTMDGDENRMNRSWLDAMNHAPTHVAVGLVWGFLFALALATA